MPYRYEIDKDTAIGADAFFGIIFNSELIDARNPSLNRNSNFA